MIAFDTHDHRFHLRAAAICLRKDRTEILLHRLEGDPIWALPGGRVEAGEDAASGVVREMLEETGEAVSCERLVYVVENFYVHNTQAHHEVGFYFLIQLPASSTLLRSSAPWFGEEGNRRLEFGWFATSTLASMNLHPVFLRSALGSALPAFAHIVQRN